MTSKAEESKQQMMQQEPPPYNPADGVQTSYAYGQPVYMQPGSGGYHQPVVMVAPMMQNPPPDYMVYAIIVTICCCWPIGIFAIMKAMACREAINRGDRATAEENSQRAKHLSCWALGIGIVFFVIGIAALVVIYAVLMPMWTQHRFS